MKKMWNPVEKRRGVFVRTLMKQLYSQKREKAVLVTGTTRKDKRRYNFIDAPKRVVIKSPAQKRTVQSTPTKPCPQGRGKT